MSGHSKWSKVKHQKATTDVVRGLAFTKASRAITIAVREGGGITDPDKNFKLRLAIDKAHEVNMPKENISRAIERGNGSTSEGIEPVLYEGYGPGGVAILIEAATDNRGRTVSVVKNTLERGGGRLGAPGSVSFLFRQKGIITVPKGGVSYDDLLGLAIELGAQDVMDMVDVYEITTEPNDILKIRDALIQSGREVDNHAVVKIAIAPISALEENRVKAINTLVEKLEALEDVQHVYTNIV